MLKATKLPNGGDLYEDDDGTKHWYLNGKRHREDSPAVEYTDGSKSSWYLNGYRHRTDGPAWEGVDGSKEWWINGECLPCTTQKQFERLMRLKAFW
jgi:hypothetical protein